MKIELVSKKQFTNSAIWKLLESFSSKGISFIVSIVLARILLPEAYGVIALTQVFTNLSDILIDGGFSTTLIRKKNVDDCDYSCALTVSLSIATILYVVFFIAAPFIGAYYETRDFCLVLRIIGLTLFIQAFTATRTVYVNRSMQFKVLCQCNVIACIISGICGIVAAYMGCGVWALVIQRMLQQFLVTLLLFSKTDFKIKFHIDARRLKEIITFSVGVMGGSLLYFISNNLYGMVVGKKYSVTDLGYYSKGCQFPEQLSLYTFSAVSGVLLPTISSCQDDYERVKHIIRKITHFSSYVIFPLMAGLFMVSDEVIIIILTEKWLPASGIMKGWCIYYLAMPFTLMYSQVYYALGHSYTKLKIEVVRMCLMAIGMIVGVFVLKCSISVLAFIGGVIMVIIAVMSAAIAARMLSYSILEFISDIWKPMMATCLMVIGIVCINIILRSFDIHSVMASLIIKMVFGVLLYLFMSIIFRIQGLNDIKSVLINNLRGQK